MACRHHHRADRLVAGAQALGDADQVGGDSLLFAGKQAARAAHAAHDFVEDQQDAMTLADGAHVGKIAGDGGQGAGGGAHYRFGDKGQHIFRAQFQYPLLQFPAQARHVVAVGFTVSLVAVRIAGRHMRDVDQQRRELLAAPGVAAGGQRAQGVAVIALAARDEMAALRLAALDTILARQLQRAFHRFRAARDKIHAVDAGRRPGDQEVGQCFHRCAGKERAVRISHAGHLPLHGGDHGCVRMSEAGDGRAAAGVQVALAVGIDQVGAVAGNGGGVGGGQAAVEDMAHGGAFGREGSASIGLTKSNLQHMLYFKIKNII